MAGEAIPDAIPDAIPEAAPAPDPAPDAVAPPPPPAPVAVAPAPIDMVADGMDPVWPAPPGPAPDPVFAPEATPDVQPMPEPMPEPVFAAPPEVPAPLPDLTPDPMPDPVSAPPAPDVVAAPPPKGRFAVVQGALAAASRVLRRPRRAAPDLRLACPSCGTIYRIAAHEALSGGREVRCARCDHQWRQASW